MNNNPLVSIIVPVYNVAKYLPRCIESLLEQTYSNLEILLIDDGATDKSGELCDEYAQKDSRITVIHKTNGGLSSARNAGLDVATGEWIQFVDSDDYIASTMVEDFLSVAFEDRTSLVICGRTDVYEETGESIVTRCPTGKIQMSSVECLSKLLHSEFSDMAAWDKFYHCSLWKKHRFPEGLIYEDVATTYKIIAESDRISFLDKPNYFYYHRPNSITTTVSINIFDYCKNTQDMFLWIKEKYPAIEKDALYVYMLSVVSVLKSVCLLSRDKRKKLNKNIFTYLTELRRYTIFWLTYPFFSKGFKLSCFSLVLNLYRPLAFIKKKLKSIGSKLR